MSCLHKLKISWKKIEESTDYEDPNEQSFEFIYNIDQCYIICFNNPQCLAYTWNYDTSICLLKFNLEYPVECNFDNSNVCYKIPGNFKRICVGNKF